MKKLKVAQFGLGPIGLESLKLAATQASMEVVGGIDIDPAKVGKSLADLTGVESLRGARVHASFDALFASVHPDVILHTASSSAEATLTQVRGAIDHGLAVASTCEELIFPALKAPSRQKTQQSCLIKAYQGIR